MGRFECPFRARIRGGSPRALVARLPQPWAGIQVPVGDSGRFEYEYEYERKTNLESRHRTRTRTRTRGGMESRDLTGYGREGMHRAGPAGPTGRKITARG